MFIWLFNPRLLRRMDGYWILEKVILKRISLSIKFRERSFRLFIMLDIVMNEWVDLNQYMICFGFNLINMFFLINKNE